MQLHAILERIKKLGTGGKVKIKSWEELSDSFFRYYNFGLTESMLKYAGRELYIKRINHVYDNLPGGPYFMLLGNEYVWSVHLFDFEEERTIKKYSLE